MLKQLFTVIPVPFWDRNTGERYVLNYRRTMTQQQFQSVLTMSGRSRALSDVSLRFCVYLRYHVVTTTTEVLLMAPVTVGIRDLKAQLSKTIQQVKAGETVIITERGKPIGRICQPNLRPRQG